MKKNDFIEAINQTWAAVYCVEALCPSTYCMKVLSLDVDLIPRPSFTPLWQSNIKYLFQ